MQIPILLEPIEGDRYRARAGEPLLMSAEADTRLEAFEKLRQMILARLRAGAELFALEVKEAPAHSIYAGSAKNNPLWDVFLECIAENRRREDAQNP